MTSADLPASSIARPAARTDPAYQAFLLLRTVFTVAPILFVGAVALARLATCYASGWRTA